MSRTYVGWSQLNRTWYCSGSRAYAQPADYQLRHVHFSLFACSTWFWMPEVFPNLIIFENRHPLCRYPYIKKLIEEANIPHQAREFSTIWLVSREDDTTNANWKRYHAVILGDGNWPKSIVQQMISGVNGDSNAIENNPFSSILSFVWQIAIIISNNSIARNLGALIWFTLRKIHVQNLMHNSSGSTTQFDRRNGSKNAVVTNDPPRLAVDSVLFCKLHHYYHSFGGTLFAVALSTVACIQSVCSFILRTNLISLKEIVDVMHVGMQP